MKGLDLHIVVRFSFIFNVRVNPDNADNTVSIRHPSGKIVIPNDNFGINQLGPQNSILYMENWL